MKWPSTRSGRSRSTRPPAECSGKQSMRPVAFAAQTAKSSESPKRPGRDRLPTIAGSRRHSAIIVPTTRAPSTSSMCVRSTYPSSQRRLLGVGSWTGTASAGAARNVPERPTSTPAAVRNATAVNPGAGRPRRMSASRARARPSPAFAASCRMVWMIAGVARALLRPHALRISVFRTVARRSSERASRPSIASLPSGTRMANPPARPSRPTATTTPAAT